MLKIGITIGDVAGVGPEVTLRALAARAHRASLADPAVAFTLIGPAHIITSSAALLGVEPCFDVEDTGELDVRFLACGRNSAVTGDAAHRAVEQGAALVRDGRIDALVTAPISKTAWAMAGYTDPGHTELLASLATRVPGEPIPNVVMGFVGRETDGEILRVALATIHKPLSQVPILIRRARLVDILRVVHHDLKERFAIADPVIGVAGLNPHAGESGRIGREDLDEIAPAVIDARADGFRVEGPLPGDAIFASRMRRRFDLILAMYHDQGLAPFKALTSGTGVNVTLGLPFIRTSPDHGTAFDIAAQWSADPGSMSAAIDCAVELASRIAAKPVA